jgi:hypothetical protein
MIFHISLCSITVGNFKYKKLTLNLRYKPKFASEKSFSSLVMD